MSDGRVTLERAGPVATVWFDRPESRNAMTTAMYEQFAGLCRTVAQDPALRVVVFRGVGGKAFVAGTDISRFRGFASGDDGVTYEREMEAHIADLCRIPVPTLAVIEGYAVGGGLNIAAACDIRIATTGSRFGVPIARTVGNCLAMPSYMRMVSGFGESRAKRMLLLGDLLEADEAQSAGFLARLVEPAELDATLAAVVAQIVGNAPLTLMASKEALRRLAARGLPEDDDFVRRVYASKDFARGVKAFFDKSKPDWCGE